MNLNEFKTLLSNLDELHFCLPNGERIPAHFHITEIGSLCKNFIDCGGTVRKMQWVSFQLWSAYDIEHRLKPAKLLGIIALSERHLDLGNDDILVEYQDNVSNTIGLYQLHFEQDQFVLSNTQTNCLALDQCGIPAQIPVAKACGSASCC